MGSSVSGVGVLDKSLLVIDALEDAKAGDRIWIEPWSHDVLIYYKMHGLLRSDVKILINVSGVQSVLGPDAPQQVAEPSVGIVSNDRPEIGAHDIASGGP